MTRLAAGPDRVAWPPQAKDPKEILAHQSEYVKKQLAAMEEHAKELGTSVLKVVTPDK